MEATTKNFSHAKLTDEPIITAVLEDSFHPDDLTSLLEEAAGLLDEADEPCYYITAVGNGRWPLEELIRGANTASRGTRALLHHPMMKELVVVTESKVIEVFVKGLRHDVFGNVKVQAFLTKDEALVYARSR